MAQAGAPQHGQGLHHWGDILALVLYFILTISIAIWSMCRPTRNSVQGYFLAGRIATWWTVGLSLYGTNISSESLLGLAGTAAASGIAVILFEWHVGLSLFGSNISSEHFIGQAGSAAVGGIAVLLFEWHAIFLLALLGWAFLPVYLMAGVYTLPEYLHKRFGGQRLRLMLTLIVIIQNCACIMPADLYSGGLFIQESLGWNIYLGVLLIIFVSTLYTVLGGLLTVLYTDSIQVFIMVAGAVVVSIIGMQRVGGMQELRVRYMDALPDYLRNNTNATCGRPPEYAWHMFRDLDAADYPALPTLLRVSLGGLSYWCARQTIVQRALAAKNITHAKGGVLLASFLKLTPFFLMVIPGMVSRVIFPNEVGCADPDTCMRVCGSRVGCSNIAYPKLVLEILPTGLRGLMLAVMLSAVISSLTSMYNSVSTVATIDIWMRLRKHASPRELLLVGRLCVLLLVGISVSAIPLLQNAEGGQMFKYATSVLGYLGAPLASTFILAMFWHRTTEVGAFWGFLVATVPGLVRFGLDVAYIRVPCGQPDLRPSVVSAVHPYYCNALQVALGLMVSVVISLLTKPLPQRRITGLTFWTRYQKPLFEQDAAVGIELLGKAKSENTATNMDSQETADPAKLNLCSKDDAESDIGNNNRNSTLHDCEDSDQDQTTCSSRARQFLCDNLCGAGSHGDQGSLLEDFEVRKAKLQEPRGKKITMNVLVVLLMVLVIALYVFFR